MVAAETSADATTLLARWRAGDLEACHRLTQHLQPDAFDLAVLLTGDAERAADLAVESISSILNERGAIEGDLRSGVLEAVITLARQRQEPFASGSPTPTDDERTRLQAALAMASLNARAMIGLTCLLGVEPGTASTMIGNAGPALTEQTAITERRLREAAGAHSAAQLYLALSRFASSFSRPDLWPVIEPQARARLARQRRRARIRNGTLLIVVITATLGGLYWLIDPGWGSGEGTESQSAGASLPIAEIVRQQPLSAAVAVSTVVLPDPPVVPDAELVIASDSARDPQSSFYRLADQQAVEIGAGSDLLISRDASWFVLREPLPDSMERFTAVNPATMQSSWSITAPKPSAATMNHSALVLLQSDGDSGYRLDRYAADDGSSLPPIPIPETANDDGSRVTQLIPGQDDGLIYVLIGTTLYDENLWALKLVTIDTATGQVIDRLERQKGPGSTLKRDFGVTGARLTVDGSALYSVIRFENRDRIGVQFLDLESGDLTSLTLPFPRRLDSGLVDVQAIPSNSGRLLYVLSTLEREIAVIDLVERQINGIFPVEPGQVQSASYFASFRRASYVLGDLSPDGKLLYLGLIALNDSQSPIWVIDTSTWQATRAIQIDGIPRGMHLAADGSTLWLQVANGDDVRLTAVPLDGSDERPLALSPDMENGELWLTSLHGFYRWQYGRTPATKSNTPVDNEQIAILPAARVDAGPITAGVPREITVQLVDPLTGAPLEGEVEGVRFDPDAQMLLTLTHESGATSLLMPYRTAPGSYRGMVKLDRSGKWTLTGHLTSTNGASWDIPQLGRLDVLPGLVGDDGRAYLFEAQPETMVSGRTVTIFGWMVSARNDRRIRDDVELESGFPRIIRLELLGPGLRQRIVLLERLAHGRYLGWVRLEEPGNWKVTATIARNADDPLVITLPDWQLHELGSAASIP